MTGFFYAPTFHSKLNQKMNDTITPELKEKFEEIMLKHAFPNNPRVYDQLMDAFKAAHDLGSEKDKWISVETTPPTDSNRYWCYVEEVNDLGKSHFQWNCYYDTDKKEFRDNGVVMRVTHYQPLPNPPQDK